MTKRIINKIRDRYYLHRFVFPFVKRNENRVIKEENTLCLFCHPRGGSTWLAEILLNIPDSCLIDEPLQKGKIKNKGVLKNRSQPYRSLLNPDNNLLFEELSIPVRSHWKEAEYLFSDILGGRIDALSLYDEAGPRRLANAETYIVKFNYGHLIMNWLTDRFPVTPVLLTRHPCAVVASQLKMKIVSKADFKNRKNPPALFRQGVLNKYLPVFTGISGIEEYLAFWWSVKMKETLKHRQQQNKGLIIAYEGMLLSFEKEMRRLFDRIKKDPPDHLAALKFKPSASTDARSVARIKENVQLSGWKEELSQIQIRKILGVVEKFGIDVYGPEPEPDYDKLYNAR